MQDDEKDE